ncbi:SDR family oxidoreductase [Candidatus Woesearchaeota archaeon]|nr:SDR family oxidoreductase [Candidatus Woesearchaeota archaeon]
MGSKTALVTGASRGIGKAIAIELARQGSDVIVNFNRNEREAVSVVEEIKRTGRDAIAIKADISNLGDVENMLSLIKERFGKVDILVNNAGITMDRTLRKMSDEEWGKVIDVNLSNFGQTNYAASKAGIIGFTKSLAKELGKHGITVNAVAPGFIESEMTSRIPFLRRKIVEWLVPLKRIGKAEEVAYAVAFLASDDAGYITGQVICVSGGLAF